MRLALALLILTTAAQAQWQIQQSNTTADLRGIHSLGNGVAWASGSKGTVLRTVDQGATWHTCTTPPGAEALDFRGVQAFDARSAIVMSSGKGDQSRLYKTTDACKTWRLIFSNADPDGFWDAVKFSDQHNGVILGDPVGGRFVILVTFTGGTHWTRAMTADLAQVKAGAGGAFAASNSSLLFDGGLPSFVTGGPGGAFYYYGDSTCTMMIARDDPDDCARLLLHFEAEPLPIPGESEASGAFAVAQVGFLKVAVGGQYTKPDVGEKSAAFSLDLGATWSAAETTPHGYRSSVAYSSASRSWITVGPNGTDVSDDDGRNWHALNPDADQSKHWNALSLPFVVGPHGRIGLLVESALKAKP